MENVAILEGLAAAILLLCVAYGPWQSACVAWARQVVFDKRDQIFDIALSGRLEFGAESYIVVRSSLERLIRFAHYVTLPRFLLLSRVVVHLAPLSRQNQLATALDGISDADTKKAVSRLVHDAQMAIFIMMVARSPLFMVCAVVLLPLVVLIALVAVAVEGYRWVCRKGESTLHVIGRVIQSTAEATQ